MAEITGDFTESIRQIQAATAELKESDDMAEKERVRNSVMSREDEILDAMSEVPTDKIIDAMLDSNELRVLLDVVAERLPISTAGALILLQNYAYTYQYAAAEKIVCERHAGEGPAQSKLDVDAAGMSDKDF